jgi:hypothetical protein
MNTYTAKDRETLRSLERTVERAIGCKAADLRNSTLDEQRTSVEQKRGHRLVFRRTFPLIGRGNILRDRTQSRDEIDQRVDRVLR